MIARQRALFGSGGNPQNFYDDRFDDTADVFKWLKAKNIDSYEYQAGNGLRAGAAALRKIGEEAAANGIILSVHAPYYISLASDDEEIIAKSVGHIAKTLGGAKAMGAGIIVVHCGGLGKKSRGAALEKAKSTLAKSLESLHKSGKTDKNKDKKDKIEVKIGLETMGKQNQLGTLEEVLELCGLDREILLPVVDFGHLHARETGEKFKTREDYHKIFEAVGESLGDVAAKYLHCHFSKIEYTKMGEKKHLAFADEKARSFGPDFEPLCEVLRGNRLFPNIICESDGTMDVDALFMKEMYDGIDGAMEHELR